MYMEKVAKQLGLSWRNGASQSFKIKAPCNEQWRNEIEGDFQLTSFGLQPKGDAADIFDCALYLMYILNGTLEIERNMC